MARAPDKFSPRQPCDFTDGQSKSICEQAVCDRLGITRKQLYALTNNGDLTEPRHTMTRILYLRAEVEELYKALGYNYPKTEAMRPHEWRKSNFHLNRGMCAPPSTWWYQARVIAARMISHPRKWRCPAKEPDDHVIKFAHRLKANRRRKQLKLEKIAERINAEPQDSVCALYSAAADYMEATGSERWQIQMARQKANAESERRARLGDQGFRTEIAP